MPAGTRSTLLGSSRSAPQPAEPDTEGDHTDHRYGRETDESTVPEAKQRHRRKHGRAAAGFHRGRRDTDRDSAGRASPAPDQITTDRDQIHDVEHTSAGAAVRARPHHRLASRKPVGGEV